MSIESNKALTQRFYTEVVNQKNLDLIDDLVTDDFVEHEQMPGIPNIGPKAVRQAFEIFFAAFPDIKITVDDTITEGDKVVTRGSMSGTHTGEFMGIPATDKSFSVGIMDIVEIHDGKATAHWGRTDVMGMMQQLGLAPEM